MRDLNEIFVNGQTTVLSFGGASVAQVITGHLLVCLLNELKEKYRPRLMVLSTIPQNPEVGTPVADLMNGNVTRWNEMTRSLVRSNPSELRLMDLENMLRMVDHLALTSDGIHFNTQQGRNRINDVFQTHLREMEQELRTTSSLAGTSSTGGGRVRGNVPESLANRLGPLAMETGAAAPVAPSSDVRVRLGTAPPPRTQPLESRLGRSVDQNKVTPRPCLGVMTRPLQQKLLRQQDN